MPTGVWLRATLASEVGAVVLGVALGAAALTLVPVLPRVPRPRPPATRAPCHER